MISQSTGQPCNNFDAIQNFSCAPGYSIRSVSGSHDDRTKDRIYCYTCQYNFRSAAHCYQTGFVNNWDVPVVTLCESNYYIAGVYSYHDDRREDRRFNYKCCENTNQCTRNCSIDGPVNYFDRNMNYELLHGHVIVGAFSWHRDDTE